MAVAAALWGTDGLLRLPLADALPAATVVFAEHLLVVAVLLPLLPRAVRALLACGPVEWVAVLVIAVVPRRWLPPCSPLRSRAAIR